ncbi:MAG: outer membrane protein [Legionella sp.]|jgi:outer membrane immunogenic protein
MFLSNMKHRWMLPSLSLLFISTFSIAGTSGIKELPTATTSWPGFYAGINGGYSWANANTQIVPLPLPAQLPIGYGTMQPASLSVSMSSGVFGGQIGYNWQLSAYPQVYLGLETDINWNSLKGATTGDGVGNAVEHFEVFNNILSTQQETNWFGTLRGRLGYTPTDFIFLYGTGGLAYGSIKEMANVNFIPGNYGTSQYPSSVSATQTGWTAGGGVEWAPRQMWSVKLEYLYYDLGSITAIANPVNPNPPFQTEYTWSNPTQLIRLGLNYLF